MPTDRKAGPPLLVLLALLLVCPACSTEGIAPLEVSDGGDAVPPALIGLLCGDEAGDDDLDGIPNGVEGCKHFLDSDRDGIPDWLDTDSDGDQIPDAIEAGARGTSGECVEPGAKSKSWPCDTDGDKVPDYLDRDSDGDGLSDGDEDANHDGSLGCCIKKCGVTSSTSQRDTCPLSAEGCGPGQSCVAGVCTPAVAVGCSMGETSPRKTATFGARPDASLGTEICHGDASGSLVPRSRISVLTGGSSPLWHLVLDASAVTSKVKAKASGKETAAAFDLAAAGVAGFVSSRKMTRSTLEEETEAFFAELSSGWPGGLAVERAGFPRRDHAGYPTIAGLELSLEIASGASPSEIRDRVLAAAVEQDLSELAGLLPASAQSVKTLVVRLYLLEHYGSKLDAQGYELDDAGKRCKDTGNPPADSGNPAHRRLIVLGAVADLARYQDLAQRTAVALDDLTEGTGLTTLSLKPSPSCFLALASSDGSPVLLPKMPLIGATLGVALDGKALERSREVGFDFDPATRAVTLYGLTPKPGVPIAISFEIWVKQSCLC
jgi:hypothetical protein